MIIKLERLIRKQCIWASISIRYCQQSSSPHRCWYTKIDRCHIEINRHRCCSQLCRGEL